MKIGDRVRIISMDQNYSPFKIGSVFVIKEICRGIAGNYYRYQKGISTGVIESSLELVNKNLDCRKLNKDLI